MRLDSRISLDMLQLSFPLRRSKICYFVQGLRPQLRMGIYVLVTLDQSFLDIVGHTYSLKQISLKEQG